MDQHLPQPTFISRIAYKDLKSAIEWLEKAFAFTTTTRATGADGNVVYAEMRFGNGVIQIGSEWENIKAPSSVAGANTQTITVHLKRTSTSTASPSRHEGVEALMRARPVRRPQIGVTISPLADLPSTISLLAGWFHREWSTFDGRSVKVSFNSIKIVSCNGVS